MQWPESWINNDVLDCFNDKELFAKFSSFLTSQAIPENYHHEIYYNNLILSSKILNEKKGKSIVVGVNGAQGSGKSTVSSCIEWLCINCFNEKAVTFSIDDIYLTKSQRQNLGESVHPLLVTRGVPGTHDTRLGRSLINTLKNAEEGSVTRIPRFDKANDDRCCNDDWIVYQGKADVIILEGWCVGANPQKEDALMTPVNELEQKEDEDAAWRIWVNERLKREYNELFDLIDLQIFLKIPDFDKVLEWRSLQEKKLQSNASGNAIMDEIALKRFIQHYERITRHCLATMGETSDISIGINDQHQFERLIYA